MVFNFFRSKNTPAKKPGAKGKAPSAPEAPAPTPLAKLKKANIARRFSILAEIKEGSMSQVYKAVDNEAGRLVCLKVQDLAKTASARGRATLTGRLTEGEVGTRIRHPNVVKTFEYGLTNKKEYWLTMEFIEGNSLQFIKDIKSRDLPGKLDLLIQTADGLAAIHAAGFIHHDFGPKNVLVNRQNVAKIIDLGLAVPNTPAFQRPGNRTGTLNYMAPEVLRREPKDERIDIYSFGITAFELLSDKFPFDISGDHLTVLRLRMNAEPIDIAQAAPDLPPDLCAIVRKAMARYPKDRWSSMTALANALRALPMAPKKDEEV